MEATVEPTDASSTEIVAEKEVVKTIELETEPMEDTTETADTASAETAAEKELA